MTRSHSHFHTVLVVDDNADLRDAITILLALNGMRAHEARDGREALQVLQEGLRPCLIVLDLHMPRMDGVAFRQAQQDNRALRDIPVMVLSALPRFESIAEPLGVVASLAKPVDPERLIALVGKCCPSSGQRARA